MSLQGEWRLSQGRHRGSAGRSRKHWHKAGADIVVADLDPSRSKDTVSGGRKVGAKGAQRQSQRGGSPTTPKPWWNRSSRSGERSTFW